MNIVQKHLDILGHRVKDRVTGVEGIATSLCFDLYGCIQVTIDRGLDKDGKPMERFWFDIQRLNRISKTPIMDRPNFVEGPQAEGKQGPADKPVARA